jgi:hypothetical protein
MLIALKAKQTKAVKNRAMWVLVSTPSHYGRGREMGTLQRLVNIDKKT